MKHLATVMDRLEAGNEAVVREQMEEALGLWTAAHGMAARVVAVSENSVAFADNEDNLWAGHYVNIGESIVLTDVQKVLNINEESTNTGFLDDVSQEFVKAVVENREDDASALVGLVLEYKQKAIRAGKLTRINDPATRARNYRKKSYSARWHIEQAAKKTAKKTAYKASKGLRQAKSARKRKMLGLGPNKGGAAGHKHVSESALRREKAVVEALGELPQVVASILAITETMDRLPVVEGTIVEASTCSGSKVPTAIQTKGGKGKDGKSSKGGKKSLPWMKDEDDKDTTNESADDIVKAITEGRTHSTGIKVNVTGMKGVPDGEYEIQKANSRSCHLLKRGGKGEEHAFHKCPTKDVRRASKAAQKVSEAITASSASMAGRGIVIINPITERFDPKDFLFGAANAWEQFRASPVSESVGTLIKEGAEATAIVEAQPMFLLCTEQEVYDAIHTFFDEIDPNAISEAAKAIVAIGQTDDGKAQIREFFTHFNDQDLTDSIFECLDNGVPLSESLDDLLLEGPKFDFGTQDDLGSDNLDDDEDTEGMDDLDDEGLDDDEDLDMDDDMDDDMGGDQTVSLEIDASELREKLQSILDVIGDEIEDSEEFDELRDMIEDEEAELDSDILTRTLSVVDDYFSAVGKSNERDLEGREEEERGEEGLDDMEGLDDGEDEGQGDDLDDEGTGTDFGSEEDGDIDLGG